ncbi:hypothetical protein LYSHEL_06110 [Lysobacter helvus]|uniref:Uncharacterized protein n=2 Tax=Lysobacteraceae TaxID=32033 RepID=A0ABM7Q2Y3_9GAMM|nr:MULTISPECIES: hypothetical protein [Lysobacter]BCT91587.1 hypothetical protein LYSCAS_06110 [Lysobacter caseinilyticus]BCT94740.1 hypothetical protein LYSHEL_06110 [Lysobacter helvus]
MQWAAYVSCHGKRYSLQHFHGRRQTYRLPPTATRPRARDVTVGVKFGLHCFTRRAAANESAEPCAIYHANPEGRIFCETRHAMGEELPRIVATMLDRNCYLTDRRNHVLFSTVRTEAGEDYAVFFALRRASPKTGLDANLMVLSAHPRRGFRPGGKPDKFRHLLRALL